MALYFDMYHFKVHLFIYPLLAMSGGYFVVLMVMKSDLSSAGSWFDSRAKPSTDAIQHFLFFIIHFTTWTPHLLAN